MIGFSRWTSSPFHLPCEGAGLAEVDTILAIDAISAAPAANAPPMTVVAGS